MGEKWRIAPQHIFPVPRPVSLLSVRPKLRVPMVNRRTRLGGVCRFVPLFVNAKPSLALLSHRMNGTGGLGCRSKWSCKWGAEAELGGRPEAGNHGNHGKAGKIRPICHHLKHY